MLMWVSNHFPPHLFFGFSRLLFREVFFLGHPPTTIRSPRGARSKCPRLAVSPATARRATAAHRENAPSLLYLSEGGVLLMDTSPVPRKNPRRPRRRRWCESRDAIRLQKDPSQDSGIAASSEPTIHAPWNLRAIRRAYIR